MDTVVTLICNPAAPGLVRAIVERAREAMRNAGFEEIALRSLAEGIACDLRGAGAPADFKSLADDIRRALGGAPVDVVAQSAEGRRKRLLVADMDSTIIEQECIDELAGFAGRRAEIAAITERAMRGELDFESALMRRLSMLAGLSEQALEQVFRDRITLTPGARTLVRTMKKFGAHTALVSGGFTYFTSRVAAAAGFDFNDANVLEIENGRLTGRVVGETRGRAAKEAALMRYAEDLGLSLSETLAVGDGANDLAMLATAGLGVAFRAKPAVALAADTRIEHGDLTALLYLQGFPQSAFAE